MIFVLFGKPDKIIGTNKSQRTWQYKKLGLSFTFVSYNDFSVFNLLEKGQIYSEYMPR